MVTRRSVLKCLAGTAAAAFVPQHGFAAHTLPRKTTVGLVVYCCQLRRKWEKRTNPGSDLFEPFTFLEHCHQVGAGGMQVPLGVMESGRAETLKDRADELGMYVEAIVQLPGDRSGLARFDAQMKTAARAGARAARTTMIPGRRYEYFQSLEQFRQFELRGRQALELAAPVAEKHRVPLALENHKDQRNAQRVAILEQIGSQYVGACVDTGNSFALLEDPIETVKSLAPWAKSVHLKDQAVQSTDNGFRLGDTPLGHGFLDLNRMVSILRERNPDIRFSLELITRDPLSVPCLENKYWTTFPQLPARDLARTLRTVKAASTDRLQQVSTLSVDRQVALEDANIRASLDYAREQLGLR